MNFMDKYLELKDKICSITFYAKPFVTTIISNKPRLN